MRSPVFRFSILLLAGIFLSRLCHLQSPYILIVILLLVLTWLTAIHHAGIFSNTLVLSAVVLAGFLHHQIWNFSREQPIEPHVWEVELIREFAGGWEVRADGRYYDGKWFHSGFHAVVYDLPDDGFFPGEELVMYGAMNIPSDGDFKNYLVRRGVNRVFNLRSYRILPDSGSPLRDFRGHLDQRISRLLKDPEHRAVVRAILLGDKSGLSEEIRTAFQRAGGMHVLAVSGLHVSIIYLMLRLILSIFPRYFIFRWISFIIMAAVLAGYAAVTGFTPSVNRAVLFFLLFGIAELAGRKARLLNVLPATACLVWLIDPGEVFALSFQLSYAAVLGIMLFQPGFEKILKGIHAVPAYVLRMIAISFCAQLFTWPLTAIYFGGISPVGLLFSAVLVPAVFALVILSIAGLLLMDLKVAGQLIPALLEIMLEELGRMIFAAAAWQWSYQSVSINFFVGISVILTTLLVYVLLILPSRKSMTHVLAGFGLVCLLYIFSGERNTLNLHITDGHTIYLSDFDAAGNVTRAKYNIEKYPMQLIKFGNSRILIISSGMPAIRSDAAVVMKGSILPDTIPGKPVLILAAELSGYERRQWIYRAREAGLDYRNAGWGTITLKKKI